MPDPKLSLIEAIKREGRWAKEVEISPSRVEPVLVYGRVKSDGTIVRATDVVSAGGETDVAIYQSALTTAGIAPQIAAVVNTTEGLTGELIEVLGATASIICDANVANRVMVLYFQRNSIAAAGPLHTWDSDSLTATGSQVGVISLTGGAYHTLNDNGVVANSAAPNNPLPLVLRAADAIVLSYTNVQVGDISRLEVAYRRLA